MNVMVILITVFSLILSFHGQIREEFLKTLINWGPFFEEIETGLSLKVLGEAMAVAGWQRPGLEKVYRQFLKPLG